MANHGDDEQYSDRKIRCWVGVVLSVPLLVITMRPMVGLRISNWMRLSPSVSKQQNPTPEKFVNGDEGRAASVVPLDLGARELQGEKWF